MLFNIIITLLFVLLNAFFVSAEFSIVKVRSTQIEIKRQKGSFSAKVALHLISHLNEYLSACQLGITIASLGLGWIGEPVVSKIFLSIFQAFDLDIGYDVVERISLPFAFVTITILHIVLGELAPKSLAILKAEKVSLFVAIPLRIFFIIFKPFIWLLNEMSNLILKAFGIRVEDTLEIHSEEELRQIVKSSLKFGNIELGKEKLLQNVFDFSQITVKQVMIPRNKIVAVDKDITLEQILSKFEIEGYSRIPVYDTTIDDIIGIVYAKDLLSQVKAKTEEDFDIQKIIRKPLFVKETQKIHEVLKLM
ncbi:MAG: hemolysin family protein, partial [Candidatus Kapaibacteriota bacterium]